MSYFLNFSHIFLVLVLGAYLILNLQWYSYKIERVIFKHKKTHWHLIYFAVPILMYIIFKDYFWIYFYAIHLPISIIWYNKMDKKLVMTNRVKRYFGFLLISVVVLDLFYILNNFPPPFSVSLPIALAVLFSNMIEKVFFIGYKNRAKAKLKTMKDLKIVAITASYGKTSIKNFLFHLLEHSFTTYKTPRSVNTLAGLVKDINEDLLSNVDVYIVEAGARQKGDINDISNLLTHQYAILGDVGPAHIEYFKTMENIKSTKKEVFNSSSLIKGFTFLDEKLEDNIIQVLKPKIISSTLNGIEFSCVINKKEEVFIAPILGDFNASNLALTISLAYELGVKTEEVRKSLLSLQSVEHRLQKIEQNGKVIIDDSFNGNIDGMISSYELVSQYDGRKVIITPGLVESTDELNIQLAKKIDEVFDLVILTGSLNIKILSENIKNTKTLIMKTKNDMENMLIENTREGDLILFSNDAPEFI